MASKNTDPADNQLSPEEADTRATEDNFHVDAIIRETFRRMLEHDAARSRARQIQTQAPTDDDQRQPDFITGDGEGIYGRANILDYAIQMHTTAGQLIQLAGLAIQAGPVFEDRFPDVDVAIQDAFAYVQDIAVRRGRPVDPADDVDEQDPALPEGLTADPGPNGNWFPSLSDNGRSA